MKHAKSIPQLVQLMRENSIARLKVSDEAVEIELLPNGLAWQEATQPGTPAAKGRGKAKEDPKEEPGPTDDDMTFWSAD